MDRNIWYEFESEIMKALDEKIKEREPHSTRNNPGPKGLYNDGVIDGLKKAMEWVDLTIYKYKHGIH